MNKMLMCGVAAAAIGVAWGGTAQAQGMYDWTGFYIGGNVGYGGANYEGVAGTAPYFADDLDLNGIAGGLHGGYNHQIDSFVFGVEGDLTFVDWQDTNFLHDVNHSGGAGDVNLLASIRARLGFTPTDRLLVFATGGIAFSDADYTALSTDDSTGFQFNDVGGVVGGGAEWAVTDAVSVRAEGLYYMFGDKKDISGASGSFFAGDFAEFDNAFVFRVGATLHFNGLMAP